MMPGAALQTMPSVAFGENILNAFSFFFLNA
jgi:hypothetical protein